jgi:hypothetical protein
MQARQAVTLRETDPPGSKLRARVSPPRAEPSLLRRRAALGSFAALTGLCGCVRQETTLDEPVSETLNREFRAIANKMQKVAWMNSGACLPHAHE